MNFMRQEQHFSKKSKQKKIIEKRVKQKVETFQFSN